MARVQGPLHSDSASGTFAKTLTFANWKGRKYVRERVTPTNPREAKQTGVRTMFGWLAAAWGDLLSAPDKASWVAEGLADSISAFNAFVRFNMGRWDNSDTYIGLSGDTPVACALTITTFTTTGEAGAVNVSITPSATGASGFIVYRDTAEITAPSRLTVVKVINANADAAVDFVDSGLAAGTYHYRVAAFNDTGGLGTVKADQTAVVT